MYSNVSYGEGGVVLHSTFFFIHTAALLLCYVAYSVPLVDKLLWKETNLCTDITALML